MLREQSEWWQQGFTRDWWMAMQPAQRTMVLEQFSDEQAEDWFRDWRVWARDKQLIPSPGEPGGHWTTCLVKAGRGFGKTRFAVEYILDMVRKTNYPIRIAVVGQGIDDIRRVMIEGKSGFIACSPSWMKPVWAPSVGGGTLTWPNGSQAFVYSAEDTEALRGPEFHIGWFDEPMAVPAEKRQRASDNLEFCLRLGLQPQLIYTTTPKKHKWMAKLEAEARKSMKEGGDILLVEGSTDENDNLPASFLKKVYGKYGGTRLGKQELQGITLGDEEGALWTSELLDETRRRELDPYAVAATCEKIVVAVDPNVADKDTAHEAGVVVVGKRGKERFILADCSVGGGPTAWARAAIEAYEDFGAHEIVAEANNGGALVKLVIMQIADQLEVPVKVHLVFATKSKIRRAEPYSTLYERKLVHHIGPADRYELLEDQMTSVHENVDPTGEDFDRLDAAMWGLHRLGIKVKKGPAASSNSGGGGGFYSFAEIGSGNG